MVKRKIKRILSDLGARFTKWRAVYNIGEKYPSSQSIKSNAHASSKVRGLMYRKAKMVPIVEPEVLNGWIS